MKAGQAAIFALVFAASAFASRGDIHLIDHGTFVSPDGRFILTVAPETNDYGSELPELTIKDRVTGAVQHSDPNAGEGGDLNVLTPIFFIKWTGDSKSILVISHIAHGTVAATLHFTGSTWYQHLLEPSLTDAGYFTVLSQRVGQHEIEISYAVDAEATIGSPAEFYRMSFTFDPATSRYSNVQSKILQSSAYSDKEFD